ncbi:enoyl-CoA hydratase/isomerase family protein, partial [Chloroflexota bacterium]
ATEDAQIGDQHMNFGLTPSGSSSQRMPRLIGIRKAKELLLSGDWVSGKEAERLGLVNRAVPADKFEKAVEEFAASFTQKPPQAIRLVKELVNWGMQADLNTAITLEMLASLGGGTSEASMKGIAAFEKKERRIEF